MDRYIGLDVHASSCRLGVVGPSGKPLGSHVVGTNARTLSRSPNPPSHRPTISPTFTPWECSRGTSTPVSVLLSLYATLASPSAVSTLIAAWSPRRCPSAWSASLRHPQRPRSAPVLPAHDARA